MSQRTRFIGGVQLQTLNNSKMDGYGVQITASPGNDTDSGAICFGDSGGRLLYNGMIANVDSLVFNDQCRESAAAYRTDTQYARNFLSAYVR